MNLDRDDVRAAFRRFDMPEPAFDRLVARRDRKRRNERVRAGVAAVLVVLLAAGLARHAWETTQPAHPTGERVVDVDGVTISAPASWHVVGYFKGVAKEVTLTNYEPDLSVTDPCASIPADGAMLAIAHRPAERSGRAWPVQLASASGPTSLTCGGHEHLSASWSVSGAGYDTITNYEAVANLGPDVSASDRDAIMRAFAALTFPPPGGGARNTMSPCFTGDGGPIVAEAVGGQTTGVPWTAYVTPASRCTPAGGVLMAGGDEGFSYAAPITPTATPQFVPEDVRYGLHSYITGLVGTDVAAVHLSVTKYSLAQDATLVPLGPLFPDVQVFVATAESYSSGSIEALDAAGTQLARTSFGSGSCIDYRCEGMQGTRPGTPFVRGDIPTAPFQLVERGHQIELLGASDQVLATAPITATRIDVASASVGDGKTVIFGTAPQGTEVMAEHWSSVGWSIVQSLQLRDGTVAFWMEGDSLAPPDALAAFPRGCGSPIAAVAIPPSRRAPSPTWVTCANANG